MPRFKNKPILSMRKVEVFIRNYLWTFINIYENMEFLFYEQLLEYIL